MMDDDAAVGEAVDDAKVKDIAQKFNIEDQEQLRRCLEKAAAAYNRALATPTLKEQLNQIKPLRDALYQAVAEWDQLSPATLQTLAWWATSGEQRPTWADVEYDNSGEPTVDDPYPGWGAYLDEITDRMRQAGVALRDMAWITDDALGSFNKGRRPPHRALPPCVEVLARYWARDLGRGFTVGFNPTDRSPLEPTSEAAQFVDACMRAIGLAPTASALRTVMRRVGRTYKNPGQKRAD